MLALSLNRKIHPIICKQRGSTLVEVMVVATLMVIGLMGTLSLQMTLNHVIKRSANHTIASQLAISMAERMRNNVNGVMETLGYQFPSNNPVVGTAEKMPERMRCPCDTSLKQAEHDIAEWRSELNLLPSLDDLKPHGSIQRLSSSASYQLYEITVSWPAVLRHESNGAPKYEAVTVRVGFND